MRVLGVKEVAQLLGTTPENVRMRVYRGLLPARKLGRRLVFLEDELKEYLKTLPKAVAKTS